MNDTFQRIASRAGWVWLAVAAAVSGCVVKDIDFIEKTCERPSDCPSPLLCLAASPNICPLGSRSCCQSAGDAPPFYCSDAKPILDAYCVSSCHGEIRTGSGQNGFRLDYYQSADGGLPGAKAMATRIKARTTDQKTMPPVGVATPAESERATIGRWVAGGALFCADGGVP
jgi:hypothetical protein